MRDPVVVGLHVWRGEDGRGVETGELRQGRQVFQDQSSRLAEFWVRRFPVIAIGGGFFFNLRVFIKE